MPTEVAVLVLLVVGAIGCWIGWISVQSLRQAALLRRAVTARTGGLMWDGPIAVRGPVIVHSPLNGPEPCLWYRMTQEEHRGSGKHSRWVRIGFVEQIATFDIECGNMHIRLAQEPTEVQGMERRRNYDRVGFLDSLMGDRSTRTTEEWLPLHKTITAIGRLRPSELGATLIKDPTLGLLLTPHPPERAASIEALKGIVGFLVIAAGIAVALYCFGIFRG